MKKRYWIILILLLILVITYFSGPKVPTPEYNSSLPELPARLEHLEAYIKQKEEQLPLRKDNGARIIWQNNIPELTEYSIIYLHGFGGSYRDGFPVNFQLADTLGANLYLSRWAGHGMLPEKALEDFTADAAWDSAKEALMIGEKIGKKVIIMSTSTGGTLAFRLAATYPEKVFALINLSPNVEDDVDGAFVLDSPWGYELAHLISFGQHKTVTHNEQNAIQYFDTIYPSEALVDLQVLVNTSANREIFNRVTCPVLTLYYYENILQEDEHVEVEAYPEVYDMLSTPDSLKKLVALKEPKTHFLGSNIKSQNTRVVLEEILQFVKEIIPQSL
jgi:pimeloyl-ACP methyl ester carboxylesterase